MKLAKQIGGGWPVLIALLLMAAQCNSAAIPAPPTPALPPPAGPAVPVALLSPTSGELAPFGRMMRNGATMAFEQRNRRQGILGHRLEGITYDTGCEFETARQAAQTAIAEGVRFIIGPLCSEAALAAVEPVEAAGVLMISPPATHPLVTVDSRDRTRPTIFRAAYVYDWQARAAACFARQSMQAGTAALVVDPRDDYSRRLAGAFAGQFSAHGGKITAELDYYPGEPEFAALVSSISQSGAAVVYLPVPPELVNRLAAQLAEAGLAGSVTLLGSDSWAGDSLDRTAAEGSYFTTHFELDDPRPIVQTWTGAYRADYAIEPDTLAALGYDAALMLVEAIEQAGTLDPEPVADTLEQLVVNGVSGPLRFDEAHNPLKPVPLVRLQGGDTTFVTSIELDPVSLGCPARLDERAGDQEANQASTHRP
jgi:branched-chain amino acid transport system substrate-binding protein